MSFRRTKHARDYLAQLRWPDGFVCPRCSGGPRGLAREPGPSHFMCVSTPSLGDGRNDLPGHPQTATWLWFPELILARDRQRMAQCGGLSRSWGWGGYLTAWSWLHKLRRAMVRRARTDFVAAWKWTETYVGGEGTGLHHDGRHIRIKALVVIAAEDNGRGIGRIRVAHSRASRVALGFVKDSVDEQHRADGLRRTVADAVDISTTFRYSWAKAKTRPYWQLPRVHRVGFLLKRWLQERIKELTVKPGHLDYYLDEFTVSIQPPRPPRVSCSIVFSNKP